MKFKDVLGKYKNLTNLSQAGIAKESGLAPAAISRYLKGERTPSKDSDALSALSKAFFNGAKEKSIDVDYDSILAEFLSCEEFKDDDLSEKLDRILTKYDIKTAVLARALSLDNSFVNRIRNGSRKPKNPSEFIQNTCKYIAEVRPEADFSEIIKEFDEKAPSVNHAKSTPTKPYKTKTTPVKPDTTKNTDKTPALKKSDSAKNTPAKSAPLPVKEVSRKTSKSKDIGLFDKLGQLLNAGKKSKKSKGKRRPY